MNLYRIKLKHYSQKDSCEATACLLLAKNDEDVYEWIKTEPECACYAGGSWSDEEDDNKEYDIYDDDYNVIGKRTFKEKIIDLKGDIDDEDVNYDDLYYGLTLIGWELIQKDTDFDSLLLKASGLLSNTQDNQ